MLWKKLLPALIIACATVANASASGPGPGTPPSVDPSLPALQDSSSTKADFSVFQGAIPASVHFQEDHYGYVVDDTLAPAWLDLTGAGTEVEFSTRDDDSAGPFDLGFEFKFYENVYPDLYVSTNGMISFGEANDLYVNSPMPRDTFPNNFIAPFWDDLILLVDNNSQKISKVYYQAGTGSNGRYFAVEWYNIARLGSQEMITFEVVLYENGDILFQYNKLSGVLDQATVGIEDEHGVDGMLYLHNASGLSITKAIKFIRPAAAAWRTKVFPVYRSAFAIKRQSNLSFTIRNTGNKAEADVYDLSLSSVPQGWLLTLYAGDGKTKLKDNDGDGIVDTGSLPPGADFQVVLKVLAPETAAAGDYIHPVVSATSSRDGSKSASINIEVAVPAPFAQAALDLMVGPNLRLIWKENLLGTNLNQGQQFTGSNLSVVALPDKSYIYTWEHNTSMMANLEYILMNRFGYVLKPVTTLTDNSQATNDTADRFLSLASTLSGRIGAIWVRTMSRDTDQKINQNVYFAVLDSSGNFITQPVNLTKNDLWRGKDDYDVPVFLSPRVVTTEDQRFVIAWGDERNHLDGSSGDLFFAVYDQNGSQSSPITALTHSVAGGVRYSTPALVALPGSRAVFVYMVIDPGDPNNPEDDLSSAAFLAVNSSGSVIKGHTAIPGSTGSTPDGEYLPGGTVVFAWNLYGGAQVQYMLFDSDSLSITSGPINLATPKGREAGVVSVTHDENGHAILTWGDAEQSDYLCYTLVDQSGTVLTPPMVYTYGQGNDPLINTNSYGLGNAPYDGSWQVQLPTILR